MRKIFILLIILIFIASSGYISFFIFVNTKGKTLLEDYLAKEGIKAEVASLKVKAPFNIDISNFKTKGFSVRKISFKPAIYLLPKVAFVIKDAVLEKINCQIIREEDGFIFPFQRLPAKEKNSPQKEEQKDHLATSSLPKKKKEKFFSFIVKKLKVKDGKINFIDHTARQEFSAVLTNINLEVDNFVYPNLSKFYLSLKSALEIKGEVFSDFITAKGWVDYEKKNMNVKASVNNFNYALFKAYYPPFWQPDNLELKEAVLSLSTLLNAENNKLSIDAAITLDKIAFKDNPKNKNNIEVLKTIISAFKKEGKGKPTFHIRLITKMDKPKINFKSVQNDFQKTVNMAAIIGANMLNKSIGDIGKPFKIISDSTIDGLKKFFKGLGDLFKK